MYSNFPRHRKWSRCQRALFWTTYTHIYLFSFYWISNSIHVASMHLYLNCLENFWKVSVLFLRFCPLIITHIPTIHSECTTHTNRPMTDRHNFWKLLLFCFTSCICCFAGCQSSSTFDRHTTGELNVVI